MAPSYIMAAKLIKTLELDYPAIQLSTAPKDSNMISEYKFLRKSVFMYVIAKKSKNGLQKKRKEKRGLIRTRNRKK